MQNFDTTNGKPFPRITNVQIDYPLPPGTPVLSYTEVLCVIDAAGVQHVLQGTEDKHSVPLNLVDSKAPVQFVSPSTGVDIPNAFGSYTALMMNILAITRRDQKARDAAVDAAAAIQPAA